MRTNFHRLLIASIDERIAGVADSLIGGAVTDYPQYMYTVGLIRGLRDALKLGDDIVEGDNERNSTA